MATNRDTVTGWVGWIYFAAFMMTIMGLFQIVSGLTALLNDKFLVGLHGQLLVFDITQWGWIHLIYGIIVLMAGTSLFSGRPWARAVAVVLATLNFLLQFAYLSVYPIWAIIIMVVDVMIIYALTVHGAEAAVEM